MSIDRLFPCVRVQAGGRGAAFVPADLLAIGISMPSSTCDHEVDPFRALAEGARQQVYRELAETGPIHRIVRPVGRPGWFVTGYAEARALLADPRVVKPGPQGGAFADRMPPEISRGVYTHMLMLNPPDHTRLRRLVGGVFTRRRVEGLAPRIRDVAEELLAPRGGDEVVDLIPAFAYPLPMRVISALLGVPPSAETEFQGRTKSLVSPAIAGYDAYLDDARSLLGFLHELIEEKRQNPGDDLFSDLIAARDGGDRLSEDELTGMAYLLVLAGHETTVNLIANGMLALLTHPDQLSLLRAEPERIDAVIEELLRYDGPVQTTLLAVASEPIQVGDVTIQTGDPIFIVLIAANRDPDRFPDPDRLDIRREPAGHLAFGHGIHHCVGAPLARLEARIAIGMLVERFPSLELARPAEDLFRTPSVLMHGLESLPLRFGRPVAG
ncbi:cytochrome P450 family protein [Pseudonocardia adelaidensis]